MEQTDHQRKAEKRNQGYEKKKARATLEKGLVLINTGNGKGKTTASMGLAVRALGHDMKVGVVQFIKGAMHTGERKVLASLPGMEFHSIGDGFTWKTQDRERDVATAERAWSEAARMLADPSYGVIVLDELNVILKYEYLSLEPVLAALKARPEMQHVVITGRNAPEALIEAADLVSDIRVVKHPYKEQGVKAQAGVEF